MIHTDLEGMLTLSISILLVWAIKVNQVNSSALPYAFPSLSGSPTALPDHGYASA